MDPAAAPCALLCACLCALACVSRGLDEDHGGGWSRDSDPRLEEGFCSVDRLEAASLSQQQFLDRYAYSRPVIIRGLTDNTDFRLMCSRSNLLKEFGSSRIRLSTANTFSYRKVDVLLQDYVEQLLKPQSPDALGSVDVLLQDYVEQLLKPQSPDALGSETLYFFGDNNLTEWRRLLERYRPPPYGPPHLSPALSFGLAGPGSGVPFHWHGPGYSEVIYGRKRWFLYPPDQEPHFHPNRTTLSWLRETYPHLPGQEAPLECTIRPGEVLYFPDRWWHATLNLDTSVFVSTFLG